MKISLAPIPYLWPADRVRAFYAEAAGWPVDVVYLGEVVCAKRRELAPDDWLAIADDLAAAGKEAVVSTLALPVAGSELGVVSRLCRNDRHRVEANDMGAVHLLAGRSRFVAGPHLNVYNPETLDLLAECGAERWVAPAELPGETVAALAAGRPAGIEVEVLVFGPLPLAFSARCFTARAEGVAKDACEFRCIRDPQGRLLETQEGQPLFRINGVQIQSAATANLLGELPALAAAGVDVARVVPAPRGTGRVVRAARGILDGAAPLRGTEETLADLAPHGWCDGYWRGEAGMLWRGAAARADALA